MNKIIYRILFFCIWLAILSPLLAQPSQKIVMTGSILQSGNDQPVEYAQIVFQIDSLRFPPVQTDQFGFFIFQCSAADTGKILKYYVQHSGFFDKKGELEIRSVNEPVLVYLKPSARQSERILVTGSVVSREEQRPMPEVIVELRIGETILPIDTTNTTGEFLFNLVRDDLGKVATYRIYKTGFAPRYGYLNIQMQNEPLKIVLASNSLTVSGYVKNRGTGAPLERVQLKLWLNQHDSTLQYTNRWGFFSHTFQQFALEDTLYLVARKSGFQTAAHKIYPESNAELRLELNLVPREKNPIYKNKYFIIGSAGVVALAASIVIYQNVGEAEDELGELPLPPIPPDR